MLTKQYGHNIKTIIEFPGSILKYRPLANFFYFNDNVPCSNLYLMSCGTTMILFLMVVPFIPIQ